MLITCVYLFAFVLVLSLVVLVHEGGHFVAARLSGVRVTDFSLGFGRELAGHTDKHGTRWKVCLIPLGGYVKMLGDEDAASTKTSTHRLSEQDRPYTFAAQKLWKRALIIFAGPAMNYVFAVFILTGLFWGYGELVIPPTVGTVQDNSPAAAAGLQSGDILSRINDIPMETFSDIQRAIRVTEFGKPLHLVYYRDAQQFETTVTLDYTSDGIPMMGITASTEHIVREENLGFFQSFYKALTTTYQITADTISYLKQVIFDRRSASEMRGPLGIAEAAGDAFLGGLASLLSFIATISIAIGFMNLIPIPLLDGGHLLFYAFEALIRRPLSDKVQNTFLWMGMAVLMSLIAYTFLLDVPRIIQRILE